LIALRQDIIKALLRRLTGHTLSCLSLQTLE
jgi:hypothetical protein